MANATDEETRTEILEKMETDLERLAIVARKLEKKQLKADKKMAELVAKNAAVVDPLSEEHATLVRQLAEAYTTHRAVLLPDGKTKTLVLRGGQLSAVSSKKFQVHQPAALEKILRRLGKWAQYTKPQKRKLDIISLKAATPLHRNFPPEVAQLVETERLTISLPEAKITFDQNPMPLRVEI